MSFIILPLFFTATLKAALVFPISFLLLIFKIIPSISFDFKFCLVVLSLLIFFYLSKQNSYHYLKYWITVNVSLPQNCLMPNLPLYLVVLSHTSFHHQDLLNLFNYLHLLNHLRSVILSFDQLIDCQQIILTPSFNHYPSECFLCYLSQKCLAELHLELQSRRIIGLNYLRMSLTSLYLLNLLILQYPNLILTHHYR